MNIVYGMQSYEQANNKSKVSVVIQHNHKNRRETP